MAIMPHDLVVHMASSPTLWVARLLAVSQKNKEKNEKRKWVIIWHWVNVMPG